MVWESIQPTHLQELGDRLGLLWLFCQSPHIRHTEYGGIRELHCGSERKRWRIHVAGSETLSGHIACLAQSCTTRQFGGDCNFIQHSKQPAPEAIRRVAYFGRYVDVLKIPAVSILNAAQMSSATLGVACIVSTLIPI